jgi:hypothetical protein
MSPEPAMRYRSAGERPTADDGCITTQEVVEDQSGGGVAVHGMTKDGVQGTFQQGRRRPAILELEQRQADCVGGIWPPLPRTLICRNILI